MGRLLVVGDDGRTRETEVSAFVPRAHVLTPDWRTILHSFVMPWNDSVQGVAVDTSGSEDTFWVAASGDKTIRHFWLYSGGGGTQGAEITGDRIDTAALGYSGNPNGLAYDPTSDALWMCESARGNAAIDQLQPSSRPPHAGDTHCLSGADQLHYDALRGLLYYSSGGNGANGAVRVYRTADQSDAAVYGGLPGSQAIEGVYIDRARQLLTVMNDGGYHVTASPQLNIACEYQVPLIS
jgi:sugar lactone lactonase YvrE